MENQDKQKNPSVLQLVKAFGDRTSMHGVGRALNSTSLWKRVVWSLLTLCGAGLALYQLVDVVQDYYTYPVTTLVNLKHENRIQFPAVTICNLNAIKNSSISPKIREYILAIQVISEVFEIGDHPQKVYNTLRYVKDNADYSGHEMEDMLITCMYNRKKCSPENFTYFEDGVFGKCYTFNIKDNSDTNNTRYGPQNGLILEMTIEHDEYIGLTPQAGIKVMIHEQDEAPFLEDGGILIPPGVSTSIAFKKTLTLRLIPPYGDCINATGDRSSYLSLFDQEGFSYTETACRKSCYQLSLVETCKCCDIDLPCDDSKILSIVKLADLKSIPYCDTSNEGNDCFSELESRFLNGDLPCLVHCAPACSQTTFDTVVSTAGWPSDAYLDVLKYQAEITVLKNKTFNSTEEFRNFVSKNLLRLDIFYEKLDFLEVTTKPMYSWGNIFGVIGGFLGLWLGFSILTAFEIIELCIDVFALCGRKSRKNHGTNTNEKNSGSL